MVDTNSLTASMARTDAFTYDDDDDDHDDDDDDDQDDDNYDDYDDVLTIGKRSNHCGCEGSSRRCCQVIESGTI